MDNYCKLNDWTIVGLIILAVVILVLFFGMGGTSNNNIQPIQTYTLREQLTPIGSNWNSVKVRPYDMSDEDWAELIYGGILGGNNNNSNLPFDDDAIEQSSELLDDINVIGHQVANQFCQLPCSVYQGKVQPQNNADINQFKSLLNNAALCDCENSSGRAINF